MSLDPSVFNRSPKSSRRNALEVAKEYGAELSSGRFRYETIRADLDVWDCAVGICSRHDVPRTPTEALHFSSGMLVT